MSSAGARSTCSRRSSCSALALVLARKLPPENTRSAVSYGRLVTSVVTLTVHERVFRVRALITLFIFAGFGALWGSIALPLTAAPWHLSTTEVGLFGLVGAAGAVGAARAGALADRGRAQWVTGITLVLFAVSWAPIAWLPNSLIVLIIGIVVLNLAGQAISVTNQHLIVEIDPTASSQLIGGNTVYYADRHRRWRDRGNHRLQRMGLGRRLHSRRRPQHCGTADLGGRPDPSGGPWSAGVSW